MTFISFEHALDQLVPAFIIAMGLIITIAALGLGT